MANFFCEERCVNRLIYFYGQNQIESGSLNIVAITQDRAITRLNSQKSKKGPNINNHQGSLHFPVENFLLKFSNLEHLEQKHSPAGELEMQKNLSMVFKGAMRMHSMRAAR